MNLQNQLKDTGIVAHLTLTETGEQFTLSFAKGEMAKRVHLSLAGFDIEGKIGFVPVDAPDGAPNLVLHMVAPDDQAHKVVIPAGTVGDPLAEKLNERLDSMQVILDDVKNENERLKRAVETAHASGSEALAEMELKKDLEIEALKKQLTDAMVAASGDDKDIPVETPSSHEEPATTKKGSKKDK